jgi:hypothetical protein
MIDTWFYLDKQQRQRYHPKITRRAIYSKIYAARE